MVYPYEPMNSLQPNTHMWFAYANGFELISNSQNYYIVLYAQREIERERQKIKRKIIS